jgi:hypothetical protein
MTPRLLLLTCAAVGVAPAVLWALISIATKIFFLFGRPVSLSFRLYSNAGSSVGSYQYRELSLPTALLILAGAILLIWRISSKPPSE